MSLSEISAQGVRVETLRALRDKLATQIEDTDSGRDVAALSRQLTDVLEQIDKLERAGEGATQGGTVLDELAKRRTQRGRAGSPRRNRTAS